MAANTSPIFTLTPIVGMGGISTANTARDGTGTVVTICTAGTDGTRIDYIRANATGSVSNGVVRLFLHDGSNYRLLKELMVVATTPSVTVETWEGEYIPTRPLVLPDGYSIRASTHIGEGFSVFCFGGNY